MNSQDLDIAVIGATGYTGSLCVQHIAKTFPKKLKWGIVGRSGAALERLASEIAKERPDRIPVIAITIDLRNEKIVEDVVKRCHVVINAVGPCHRYSTPILAACAKLGTHYVDFSLETPWQKEMIEKYHEKAKTSGAIIIPGIALSSSPSDLLAYLIMSMTQQKPTHSIEIVASGELQMAGMSGGSFSTVLSTMENYGTSWLTGDPWSVSSASRPREVRNTPFLERITGHRFVPHLGHLTTSLVGISNETVVYRSAGLNPLLYGESFQYREYLPVQTVFTAILTHLLTKFAALILGFHFVRTLLRRFSFEPGSGPGLAESRAFDRVEFRAVGIDVVTEEVLARAEFIYAGALPEVSGILAAEAASVLLSWKKRGGNIVRPAGLLTPSTLGMEFVGKVREVSVKLDVNSVGEENMVGVESRKAI